MNANQPVKTVGHKSRRTFGLESIIVSGPNQHRDSFRGQDGGQREDRIQPVQTANEVIEECHLVQDIACEAGSGYVFVQEPGRACLGCYLGEALADPKRSPCPGTPAVLDVLQTVCGFANFAISTLLTDRQRSFNLVRAFMSVGTATPAVVSRRESCVLCGVLGGVP